MQTDCDRNLGSTCSVHALACICWGGQYKPELSLTGGEPGGLTLQTAAGFAKVF